MPSNTTKKKTTAPKADIEETIEAEPIEKESEVELLKAQNAELRAQFSELLSEFKAFKDSHTTPVTITAPTTDVTLVYMADFPSVLDKVPNLMITCTRYGEEFTLSRSQFDQLVGAYYNWFDQGYLAVSHRNLDVAASKGLRTDDEFALNARTLRKLGTMSGDELRKLWAECESDAQRLSIVTYYKRKFVEGKEAGYRDRERILVMNALTDNGLKREAVELDGSSLKIEPKDFLA